MKGRAGASSSSSSNGRIGIDIAHSMSPFINHNLHFLKIARYDYWFRSSS